MHHDLQRRNDKLQRRHKNITATSIQFGFILLFAISAKLCFGQAALSSSAPQYGNTNIQTPHSLNPKPDTTENRFWHLLSWQNHLDRAAAEHEKQGKDGRWLRDYIQNRLGIETDQFAPVHESAQRLTEELQATDKQVRTILDQKRLAGLQSHTSPPTDSGNDSQLHQLTLDRQQAIHDEIARLQGEMGPDAFERLNSKLINQNVQQPQTYFRRTDEATQSSGQQSVSHNALLRGVALVEGAIPGTGNELDLMAEYCLDDEFNPGSCDLDVGAAVATFPNSGEIDAFAFSDMSPDFMGYYDVWPGVEMDLFQGNDDIDANRADGPEGSAMRSVSDAISTGFIYTGVATPYTCYSRENGGKKCDPVWNNQVSAVESTAAPSISSLSPLSALAGSVGTLTINGDNLLNIFDPAGQPQVSSSSSSVLLSSPPAPSPASTSVQANYSVAADAAPGAYDVTASNSWGISDAVAFTVTSVATAPLQNKAAAHPAATISPLATGGNCSSNEVQNNTRIEWWGQLINTGTGIECSTTNVFAGQQIIIKVLSTDSSQIVTTQTWKIYDCSDSTCDPAGRTTPAVNAVKGYTASAQSGTVILMTPTDLNKNTLQFYSTAPGHYEEVVVSGTFSDNSTVSAWAIFNVQGPTGSTLPNVYVQQNDTATAITDSSGNLDPTADPATLVMSNAPGSPTDGIKFQETATLPRGQFIWVQILNSVTYSQLVQPLYQGYQAPANLGPGLDGIYPYAHVLLSPFTSASDGPGRLDLYSFLGEATESFDATMYVLWDPAIPPAGQQYCKPATPNPTSAPYTATASTCASIPVPLALVNWTWKACAINALAPGNPGSYGPKANWFTQCGPGKYDSEPASGYPTWSTCKAPNPFIANCTQ